LGRPRSNSLVGIADKFFGLNSLQAYPDFMDIFDVLYPIGVFIFAWLWGWSFTHFIDQ